jgi:hypothetical protein
MPPVGAIEAAVLAQAQRDQAVSSPLPVGRSGSGEKDPAVRPHTHPVGEFEFLFSAVLFAPPAPFDRHHALLAEVAVERARPLRPPNRRADVRFALGDDAAAPIDA